MLGEVCIELSNGEVTSADKQVVLEFVAQVKRRRGYVKVGGDVYRLTSLQWHTPSEHHVNGVAYPMELQLVHEHVRTGAPLVVSVFYVLGEENEAIEPIFFAVERRCGL